MPSPILVPGASCAVIAESPRSGLLIDGADYFRAVYAACRQARRSILMLGWQFDSRVELLRGEEARDPVAPLELLDLLTDLCEERPELEVRILAWRSSLLFAFEREPFQALTFHLRSHDNLRFELDSRHPLTASQHQKVVIVDRAIAMLGGMDLCKGRWDGRAHLADDPRRGQKPLGLGQYPPYHDVQAYVTGEAVDVLRDWFVERWERGTGERMSLPDAPRDGVEIVPTLSIDVRRVGLSRTLPELDDGSRCQVGELRDLHLRAIAAARQTIYIENQYFCSEAIRRALLERMQQAGEPLEIVIVLPQRSGGLKEQIAIGVRQEEILVQLTMMAARTGHHLGVYYAAAPGQDGDVPVFIHAKVLAVDDRFLLVSSANATNRSFGLDTELGVAWETDAPDPSIRAARIELLREHCGLDAETIEAMHVPPERLVSRLDALARAGAHRLRRHAIDQAGEPETTIAHALRDDVPLDPQNPEAFEDIMPEPDQWHRHVKDHVAQLWRRLRRARARGDTSTASPARR